MPLKVEIVDREGSLFHGSAAQVSVPSVEGDLGVLPGHQPLLVVLRPGTVRVTPEAGGGAQEFPVEQGFASVDSDAVTVVLQRDLLS